MKRLPIKNDKLPVLMVGAGPTGLMMASQLARFNIPFRIIEKNKGPTSQSGALVIQPRSLEIFEQMGIAERALKQGRTFQTINYVVNGKLAQRVPLGNFGNVKGPAFHLLLFPGNETEETIDTIRPIFDKYEDVIQIRPIPLYSSDEGLVQSVRREKRRLLSCSP